MTDRELLQAAARAAGMMGALNWTPGETPWLRVNPDLSRPWNPLHEDGDAFRLAVRLQLDICRPAVSHTHVCVWVDRLSDFIEEPLGDDPYAATRRAVVRAAAAMDAPRAAEQQGGEHG